jgi:hypothetical protein
MVLLLGDRRAVAIGCPQSGTTRWEAGVDRRRPGQLELVVEGTRAGPAALVAVEAALLVDVAGGFVVFARVEVEIGDVAPSRVLDHVVEEGGADPAAAGARLHVELGQIRLRVGAPRRDPEPQHGHAPGAPAVVFDEQHARVAVRHKPRQMPREPSGLRCRIPVLRIEVHQEPRGVPESVRVVHDLHTHGALPPRRLCSTSSPTATVLHNPNAVPRIMRMFRLCL